MEFLSACKEMAVLVQESIRDLAGTPEGGITVKMGADLTPTKKIDQAAEDCIITYLQEHSLCSLLVSEEAGKVQFSGDGGTIFLDPVDGTFNAVNGIPFYALSIAYKEHGSIQQAFVQNLASGETFTAIKGKYARCNGKPVTVSNVSQPG